MYLITRQLVELGVSEETMDQKILSGAWRVRPLSSLDEGGEKEILISSLPRELQLKWAQSNPLPDYPEQIAILLSEASELGLNERAIEITELLTPLTPVERRAWIEEALRMARIIERYGLLKRKRQSNATTGDLEFTAGVHELCHETVCENYVILAKQPHRGKPLSPYTLDGLYRDYRKLGLLTFLPKNKRKPRTKRDKRRATISKKLFENS